MTGQMNGSMPQNVISALAAVQRDIGGIEKSKGKGGGLQYAFRGIDAVSAAAQPLFGKYGIVISPEVENHVLDEITVNGKPWVDATLTVAWSVYGPGGVDDKIVARTIGMGRDNSDKAYPKALTQAYKNLILRLLTIGDPQDETDGHTHERDATYDWEPPVRVAKAYEALKGLSEESKAKVKELSVSDGKKINARAMADDEAWLITLEAIIAADAKEPEQLAAV
jgi:hypothetical protein